MHTPLPLKLCIPLKCLYDEFPLHSECHGFSSSSGRVVCDRIGVLLCVVYIQELHIVKYLNSTVEKINIQRDKNYLNSSMYSMKTIVGRQSKYIYILTRGCTNNVYYFYHLKDEC